MNVKQYLNAFIQMLHCSASYQHNRLHSVDFELLDINTYSHSYAVSLQHSLEILVTFCLDK